MSRITREKGYSQSELDASIAAALEMAADASAREELERRDEQIRKEAWKQGEDSILIHLKDFIELGKMDCQEGGTSGCHRAEALQPLIERIRREAAPEASKREGK